MSALIEKAHLRIPSLQGLLRRSWKFFHTSYFGVGIFEAHGFALPIFIALFGMSVLGFFVHFEEA